MKYILSAENAELLAQFAWSRVLLGFDFDGTLAPIGPHRGAARMRPRTQRLFARVCARYPCAVISGRSRADVLPRLGKAAPDYVVGNHGMESGPGARDDSRPVDEAERSLQLALGDLDGLEFENKRYSLSVHYRRAPRKPAARAAIEQAVSRLAVPMRLVHGKAVINVIPVGAPNKGDALVRLRSLSGADTALFVGDDLTDEDVFELDQPGRMLGIRVGSSRSSAALYFLRNQEEIDELLDRLAHYRAQAVAR